MNSVLLAQLDALDSDLADAFEAIETYITANIHAGQVISDYTDALNLGLQVCIDWYQDPNTAYLANGYIQAISAYAQVREAFPDAVPALITEEHIPTSLLDSGNFIGQIKEAAAATWRDLAGSPGGKILRTHFENLTKQIRNSNNILAKYVSQMNVKTAALQMWQTFEELDTNQDYANENIRAYIFNTLGWDAFLKTRDLHDQGVYSFPRASDFEVAVLDPFYPRLSLEPLPTLNGWEPAYLGGFYVIDDDGDPIFDAGSYIQYITSGDVPFFVRDGHFKLLFEPSAGNVLTWAAGSVTFMNNVNTSTELPINAGSATYTGSRIYVCYVPGSPNLIVTTARAAAYINSQTIIAIYDGGFDLRTFNATRVIRGSEIAVGSTPPDRLGDGDLLGKVRIGDVGDLFLDGGLRKIIIGNATTPMAVIGRHTEAGFDASTGGYRFRRSDGSLLFDSEYGLGTEVVGSANIKPGAVREYHLFFGARSLEERGITISVDAPNNRVSWSSGIISWFDDLGNNVETPIIAGQAFYAGDPVFIVWEKGADRFISTTDTAIAFDTDNYYVFAQYNGGTDLFRNFQATTIDGARIQTGSLELNRIKADSILSTNIFVGSELFSLNGTDRRLTIKDTDENIRVQLGKLSATEYGLRVYNAEGQLYIDATNEDTFFIRDNEITASLKYIGEFASNPDVTLYSLGSVYKNTVNGNLYRLIDGTPRTWELFSLASSDGADGSDGINARAVSIISEDLTFEYNTEGLIPSPENALVAAFAFNTIGTVYYEFFKNDVSLGVPSTTPSFTYTPPANYADMPQKIEVQIREGSAAGSIVARDQISMTGLRAGSSTINVILSNEAHTLPATNNDVVDYTGSGLDITAYEGVTLLEYSSTLAVTPSWRIISAITSNITAGSASTVGGNVRRFADHSEMTDLLGSITFTIEVKNSAGVVAQFTKVQSLSKSQGGTDGIDGLNGLSVAQVSIFRRASTAPATPTGGSYSFPTKTLTPPADWFAAIPDGSDPIYSCVAIASAAGIDGTDSSITWSTPQIIARNGTDGLDGADGEDGAQGFNARALNIVSNHPAISYNSEGSAPSVASVTFTAEAINTSGTVYYEFFVNDVSVQNTTSNTYPYTAPANIPAASVKIEVQIREDASTGTILARDQITIPVLRSSSRSINISLSNEAHTLPRSVSGVVTYTGSGTDINVWEGTTPLPYDAALPNSSWRILSATSPNITVGAASTVSINTRRFANHSDMTSNPAAVTFTIEVRNFEGLTSTFIRVQSLSFSQQGLAGFDGVTGKSVYTAIIFTRSESAPPAPSGGSFNFGSNVLTPPSDWYLDVPEGSNPVYGTRFVFSVTGDTGVQNAGTWSTPFQIAEDGIDGFDGEDGADGISTFLVSIFRRSASAPDTPTGGSYNFTSNSVTPPTGWFASVPAGSDPLYISTSLASISGVSGTDSSLTWVEPVILAQNGLDGADGEDGAEGVSARVVNITSNHPAIAYNSVGQSPAVASVTFTATAHNTNGTVYYEFFVNDSPVQNTTSNTYPYTSPASIPASPVKIEVQIREDDSTGPILARDQITLPVLQASTRAINISLSNEAHTLPRTTAGSVDYTGSGTDINVWEGTTQLPYDGSLVATPSWRVVSATSPNITVGSASTVSTNTRQFADHSGMTSTPSSITFTIEVKNSEGLTSTFVRRQSLSFSQQGVDGDDGLSVAQITVFRRSASALATPTDGSYNFSINIITAPTGWFTTPPAGTDPLYASVSIASIVGTTGTDSSLTWSTPEIISRNGTNGGDGRSVYTAIVFQRAASAPLAPTGGSFNFGSNVLTPPAGWALDIPAGTNPAFGTRYVFSIIGDSETDTAGSWSTPFEISRDGEDGFDGEDGADGLSTFLAPIFRRSDSAPDTPTGGSYNFGTNTLTPPADWSTSPPAGTDPIYISTTLASVAGVSGTDSTLTWTTPIIFAQNGLNGADGDDGSAGTNARAVNLTASVQAFSYNTNGTAPTLPSSTITATALNTTGTVYYEFFVNDSPVQNTTSNTYPYSAPENFSSLPTKIEVQIREDASTGPILARDQITIGGLRAGSSAILISLTNEAHTLPRNTAGTVTYTGSGTDINVWEGSTQIPYNAALPNSSWRITNVAVSNITAGAASTVSTNTRRYADHSAMTASPASITFTIEVKNSAGVTTTFTRVQSLSFSQEGAEGAPGVDAITITLSNEAHSLPRTTGGVVTYTGSGTDINVWEGSTQIPYNAALPNSSWRVVSATSPNITVGAASTVSTNTRRYADHSAMTASPALVTFVIEVKNYLGVTTSFTKIQSLSFSQQGANGDGGPQGPQGALTRIRYAKLAVGVLFNVDTTPVVVAGDTAPPTNSWGQTVSSWSLSPHLLSTNEILYQVSGVYDPVANSTTYWGPPFLSSLKVGQLSAITADLGTVTAGLIRSGTGGDRTEITPQRIEVYANNILRVRIGIW